MEGNLVESLLNNIWAEFRRAGITDDLRVIEHLAELLLAAEQEDIRPDSSLLAFSAPSEFNLDDVRQQLKDASQQAGGPGVLFDRYILFRLDTMRAGGQYPTPRHIVRLMIALADTTGHTVADFACGSGGLLIHSKGSTLVGVDISPEWARLARTNLKLHKKKGSIREGNALRMVKSDERFPRIVINPPFGAKIRSEFGARSEVALISLALNHLKTDGCAALLIPSGMLFSNNSAEEQLRKRLLKELTLEAIITLPEGALQPYSMITTHLLLIKNTPPTEEGYTWFLHPVNDGYVSRRGRDLTTNPKTPNDLTLVEKAVTAFRQTPRFRPEIPLTVQSLSENGVMLGFLIRPPEGVSLLSVRHLPAQAEKQSLFLLEVQREEKRTFWKFELQALPAPEEVQNAESLVREWLGLKKSKDPLPPPDVFQVQTIRWGNVEKQTVGGLIIKTFRGERPQLMGIAIPRMTLKARAYTLQPDDYLRPPEIRAELRRPHDILLEIHQRQQAFGQRMNRLAGLLTSQRLQEHSIPGKVDVRQPLVELSEMQRDIWQVIKGFKDGESALPFTAAEINVKYTESEKRMALEIFEAMGLIVPITLKHPESGQPLNFYRLAEVHDRWTGVEEGEA